MMNKMKKYLPLILLGFGLLIAIVAVILIKNSKKSDSIADDETTVREISKEEWPLVSLVPSSDGHRLAFKVQKIKVKGAVSMDYELVYRVQNGGQQGSSGTFKLEGADVERELLLGSESSGKFRYDVGVEEGTVTLRFRDSKRKLIGKLVTTFTLKSPKKDLPAGRQGVFEVTMDTFLEGTKTFSSSK